MARRPWRADDYEKGRRGICDCCAVAGRDVENGGSGNFGSGDNFMGGSVMKVLDPCCGSRMMWFDKNNPEAVFGDKRKEIHLLKDRKYLRKLEINPDVVMDFTNIPFPDNTFAVVVFDPPHLQRAGEKSWLAKKYGVLGNEWREDFRKGFAECFRVLRPDGILIFKWSENQIPVKEILALTNVEPLIGHVSMKHKQNQTQTHWITFLKEEAS